MVTWSNVKVSIFGKEISNVKSIKFNGIKISLKPIIINKNRNLIKRLFEIILDKNNLN